MDANTKSLLFNIIGGIISGIIVFGITLLFRPQYWHKRYRYKIILIALVFCVILTFHFIHSTSITLTILLLGLFVTYSSVTLYSVKKVIFPETSPLCRLEKFIREGDYHNIEKRFPKKPFYIISIPAIIRWNLLWARKLINRRLLKEAYETYSKLFALPLFEDEQSDIRLKQVQTLLQLGDTNKAKSVFEQTITRSEQFITPETLYLQSQFYERSGELERARQSLLSAVAGHDSVQTIELGVIYNDLGRIDKILKNNMTNVIHYYRKAAEIACDYNAKFLIHITYPNLIDTYLLTGDDTKAKLFFTKIFNAY